MDCIGSLFHSILQYLWGLWSGKIIIYSAQADPPYIFITGTRLFVVKKLKTNVTRYNDQMKLFLLKRAQFEIIRVIHENL